MNRPPEPPPSNHPPGAERLPSAAKASYALGGLGDTFGHWFYAALARPVFNMQLGLSPTLVGTVLMLARLFEGFIDPLFGWMSDNTRSRCGRRRPYVLAGASLAGLALPCLFLVPGSWDATKPWMHNGVFWFMLVSALVYAALIGLYSMPYASLGSELTPDYHERTGVMAWKAVVQKCAGVYVAAAWWLARSWGPTTAAGGADVLAGARWAAWLAGGCMVLAGIVTFTGVRERYYERARMQARTRFWGTFREVFASRAFVTLLGVVVLAAVGMAIGNDLALYAGTYYVFGGDQQAMARYQLYAGGGQLLCGFLGVAAVAWLARRLGKRRALSGVLGLGILAYGSSWWLYAPGRPWLMVLDLSLMVMASTGLWVLAPSMGVDVVDDDELRSGQRREGAFNSWLSWAIKIALALSLVASGALLERTGFDAVQGGAQSAGVVWRIRFCVAVLPVGALGLAAGLVTRFPLSRVRMEALRQELEARRGRV